MRNIDLCKKSVHLTALVIMVECARRTGSLIIPQKPDKLSPAWTASIDFYPADETHVLLVIHSIDDRRDKDDASNRHAARRLLRWDRFKGVKLQHRGKKTCFTIAVCHRSGGPVVTHMWSSWIKRAEINIHHSGWDGKTPSWWQIIWNKQQSTRYIKINCIKEHLSS